MELFQYMDVFTQKLIIKLSAHEIYMFSQNDPNDWPFLKRYWDDNQFWLDLCYFHFQKRVTNTESPKKQFISEYLSRFGCFP